MNAASVFLMFFELVLCSYGISDRVVPYQEAVDRFEGTSRRF